MHNTVSWLDHIVSSVSAYSLIDDIWVKYNFVSSDHLPLCLKINLSRVNVDPGGDNSELREVRRIKREGSALRIDSCIVIILIGYFVVLTMIILYCYVMKHTVLHLIISMPLMECTKI